MLSNNRECPYIEFKDGRTWNLIWDDDYVGWIYKTKKNIYKLFGDFFYNEPQCDIDYQFPPHIWIGRLADDSNYWFTSEANLRIKSIHIFNSEVVFK